MFFVESHYLKTVGGSFAENFYGMKRRRRPGVSSERAQSAVELFTDHEKLRKKELRWSLLFLVIGAILHRPDLHSCKRLSHSMTFTDWDSVPPDAAG
jgi:hypothetical protein